MAPKGCFISTEAIELVDKSRLSLPEPRRIRDRDHVKRTVAYFEELLRDQLMRAHCGKDKRDKRQLGNLMPFRIAAYAIMTKGCVR